MMIVRFHYIIIKGSVFLIIRRAESNDLDDINRLLLQVLTIHHESRPDLFKDGVKKYTDNELLDIINDNSRPIFVAESDGKVLGYAFCIFQQHINNNILTDIKTLYIDDLCVDETARGQHIGSKLYHFVLDYAKQNGFYNVTLNVWSCNQNALKFYESLGLTAQKIGMEKIL